MIVNIVKEQSTIVANNRQGELEFREKRIRNSPKWHTEEDTKEQKKAIRRSEERTKTENIILRNLMEA